MGQRLNIEIHKNGEVLANAYYLWSGYTSSSLELLKTIMLKGFPAVKRTDNDILYAVWLLQSTGAGIPDNIRSSDSCKDFYALTPFYDRNEGIISVDDKDIAETRHWEEARINIDIGTKTFDFDCFSIIDRVDYESDFVGDDEYSSLFVGGGYPKFEILPIIDFDFDGIKFDEFDKFRSLMDVIESFKKGAFKLKSEPDDVYLTIE